MGIFQSPEKCFITDADTLNQTDNRHTKDYRIEFGDKILSFSFGATHTNSQKVNDNKLILKGLILNDKFPKPKSGFYTNEYLEKIIDEAIIPTTPKAKLVELLLFLHKHQKHEGASININEEFETDILLNKLYFKNYEEFWFYLSTLESAGFVTFINTSSKNGNSAKDIRITFSGLEYIIELQEEGAKSKKCFIAMWFNESEIDKREEIKRIVSECGYIPQIIDELHYDSEITINDAIIKNIKSSKFLIADFTGQRAGVYFEAGYALGKGKPVIYMCSAEDFKNLHFDTNHYPHIKYANLIEMSEMLENKIKAWID